MSTICKCFVRTYLDYGDMNYDQAFTIEFTQHNATLAITGSIRGTFRENIYQKLVLESFNNDTGKENYISFLRHLKTNARNNFLI